MMNIGIIYNIFKQIRQLGIAPINKSNPINRLDKNQSNCVSLLRLSNLLSLLEVGDSGGPLTVVQNRGKKMSLFSLCHPTKTF
jgi:hypothetical protein